MRLRRIYPPQADEPYMQSLSRFGLLEPRIEPTFQDRLNPYLLGPVKHNRPERFGKEHAHSNPQLALLGIRQKSCQCVVFNAHGLLPNALSQIERPTTKQNWT